VDWSDPAIAGTVDNGDVVVVEDIAEDPDTGGTRLHLENGGEPALHCTTLLAHQALHRTMLLALSAGCRRPEPSRTDGGDADWVSIVSRSGVVLFEPAVEQKPRSRWGDAVVSAKLAAAGLARSPSPSTSASSQLSGVGQTDPNESLTGGVSNPAASAHGGSASEDTTAVSMIQSGYDDLQSAVESIIRLRKQNEEQELRLARYAEMAEGATAPRQRVPAEAETMRDEGFFVVAGPVPLRASFDVESESLSEGDVYM
jgi:hypothetical protein